MVLFVLHLILHLVSCLAKIIFVKFDHLKDSSFLSWKTKKKFKSDKTKSLSNKHEATRMDT